MHSFKSSKLMPHEAKLICDIIMDIEKYPEFLPWCSSAVILSREGNKVTASLEISFKGVSQSYVSEVLLVDTENHYMITTKAISGPFKRLENIWSIKKDNNMTKVDFSIDFEFKSRILDAVMGMIFSKATTKMVLAFEDRARELLG
jgi:coenzyme Q-binding protein COQ10